MSLSINLQVEAIPAWRWERPEPQKVATFGASYESTQELLDRELWQLGCRGAAALLIVCSLDDVRRDGRLRADARPRFSGVAVSCQTRHGPMTYPCATYFDAGGRMSGWQANLRAIALSLEALRKVDRYGMARHGEQYTGWRAIEAPGSPAFASADEAVRWMRELIGQHLPADQLLRAASSKAHPDRNDGDRSLWDRVDAARQLLEKAGVSG